MSRVLVIGLDGASPSLIARWRDSLPNLDRLMADGTHGVLRSVQPPRSIPAWYCFATGMNPGKLGVFGFSQRRPNTYDYTFANLSYCQAPTFWQWLNRYGLQTVVVHVPGTFPPHPLDGAMVSGWPAPINRGNLQYTFPPELGKAIDRDLGEPFEFLSDLPMRLDNDAEMLDERLRIMKMHGRAAALVLKQYSWDVAVVVFSSIDRASHQFWRHLDPTHPAHDLAAQDRFGDALKQVYMAADAEVGRLLGFLTERDTVIVISDHGFGPARRTFYLNEWLRREGYLVLHDDEAPGHVPRQTRFLGKVAAPLFWLNQRSPLFRRLASPFKKRALANRIRDDFVRTKNEGLVRINHAPVDWSRTRAYVPDEASLYLNLQGRDPQGIVAPAEADALLAEIEAALRGIEDPETSAPVDVETFRTSDLYSGPFSREAPDLLVCMDGYATEVMAELGADLLFEPATARNGTHTMDGTLVVRGPGVRPGASLDADLIDVAPTVCHLVGAPVPAERDGEVLLDLFLDDAPPRQRGVAEASAEFGRGEAQDTFTAAEEAQVERQLRDLGYLN